MIRGTNVTMHHSTYRLCVKLMHTVTFVPRVSRDENLAGLLPP